MAPLNPLLPAPCPPPLSRTLSYKLGGLQPGSPNPNCSLTSATKLTASLIFFSVDRGAKSMVRHMT
jgi:hypothetical protein